MPNEKGKVEGNTSLEVEKPAALTPEQIAQDLIDNTAEFAGQDLNNVIQIVKGGIGLPQR